MRLAASMWLALFALGSCWAHPRLIIRAESSAAGPVFRFGYCETGRPPPPLLGIKVYAVEAGDRPVEPPVCSLTLKPDSGTLPVSAWTYGQDLPTLAVQSCRTLAPGRYQIAIGGGGSAAAVFGVSREGQVLLETDPCR